MLDTDGRVTSWSAGAEPVTGADLGAICHLHLHVVGSAPPGSPDDLNEQEPVPAA